VLREHGGLLDRRGDGVGAAPGAGGDELTQAALVEHAV
jgi:hypothetical protein